MDEHGRLFDQFNNIIPTKNPSTTTNTTKKKYEPDITKQQNNKASQKKSMFFDPNIQVSKNKRENKRKAAFIFKEKGAYLKKEQKLRQKQAILAIQNNQSILLSNTQSVQSKVSALDKIALRAPDPIPDVEWWDIPFISTHQTGYQISTDKLTHYVQHPVPITNDYIQKIKQTSYELPFLSKQIKKLVKIKRQEKQKEKQEKLQLGLIQPPPPKIKLSNWMNILSKEALSDPTRVERRVREIVKQRQQKHDERNNERKLTSQGRHQKFKRKIKKDLIKGVKIAVFRIQRYANPSQKFKVEKNALQLMLNGFSIIPAKDAQVRMPIVVIVQGGPWAVQKYKKLMLRRIKWKGDLNIEDSVAKNEENENLQQRKFELGLEDSINENNCNLVWEGIITKKLFDKWKVIQVQNDIEARKLLHQKGAEHYWSLAKNFNPKHGGQENIQNLLH